MRVGRFASIKLISSQTIKQKWCLQNEERLQKKNGSRKIKKMCYMASFVCLIFIKIVYCVCVFDGGGLFNWPHTHAHIHSQNSFFFFIYFILKKREKRKEWMTLTTHTYKKKTTTSVSLSRALSPTSIPFLMDQPTGQPTHTERHENTNTSLTSDFNNVNYSIVCLFFNSLLFFFCFVCRSPVFSSISFFASCN